MSEEHDRKGHPLPGSVSNQNGEEQPPGHGGGEHERDKGGQGRQGGQAGQGGQGGDPESGGEAGEGSQSTGHPDSAG